MSDSNESDRPRLQLSVTQVVASALAAITATFGASYLGVAGTVIGAAVASVLTVVGNAVYSHSLHRVTKQRPPTPAREPTTGPRRRWSTIAAACAGVFVGVLLVVTAVELVAGRPLTDVVRGRSGSGTTVLGDVGAGTTNTTTTTTSTTASTTSTPTPTAMTVTVTPSVVTETPTVTVTGTPTTATVTPSESTSTASDSTTPTPTSASPTSGSTSP